MSENIENQDKIERAPSVPPFVQFVCSSLPMVFDDSLTYYEALSALWGWINKEIVPVINNNASVTEEYIDLTHEFMEKFEELKSYVDNYFDNLDVQDEINNKLDAMVESGELQEIITSYINANVAWCFDTVADMQLAENLVAGSYAQTLGFHTLNDGGGAIYKIKNTGTANGMDVISVGSLYAHLVYDDKLNVRKFGAKGDGTTDCSSIINHIISLGKNSIYFPDGEYLVDEVIIANTCKEIQGESLRGTVIKAPNGFLTWTDTYKNNRFIKNLTIDGVEVDSNIAIAGAMAFSKFENVKILNSYIAFQPAQNSWINDFTFLIVQDCTYGVYNPSATVLNNLNFTSCYFQHITDVAIQLNGTNIKFDGCNFEFCGTCFEGGGRLYEVDGCYIESNTKIFNVNKASYQGSFYIRNSWLYPNTDTIANGWLGTFYTVSTINNTSAIFSVDGCYIDNKTKDTIKPFAFSSNGTKSYWAIDLTNNSYANIKTSNQYNIYYDDLFDRTNCPEYACPANALPIKTDLPLYTQSGIEWYSLSKGNMWGYGATNKLIKAIGRYEVTSTSGVINIHFDKKYGGAYPTINNLPVTVRFTDGTMALARLSIGTSEYNITVNYDGKTTAEIVFNNEY